MHLNALPSCRRRAYGACCGGSCVAFCHAAHVSIIGQHLHACHCLHPVQLVCNRGPASRHLPWATARRGSQFLARFDRLLHVASFRVFVSDGPLTTMKPTIHVRILIALWLPSCCARGVGGESPAALTNAMRLSYTNDEGSVQHAPREADVQANNQIVFTSTQAIWSAVVRATSAALGREGDADELDSLRIYYNTHVQQTGLLPVGDIYPEPRLWAQTEWAAWLLLDASDFSLKKRA